MNDRESRPASGPPAQETPSFERLPARDACFLAFERHDLHMHVGGVAIFEKGAPLLPSGELDIDQLRRYFYSRLELIPRCRQRIARVPFVGSPVWVDDQALDIAYHIPYARIPAPGGDNEFRQLISDVISQPLDRSRPLWQLWLVEGFAEPHRFGIIVKFHHCMADGLAGVDFTRRLLTADPLEDAPDPPPFRPRPLPGDLVLLRHEVGRWLRAPVVVARGLGHLGRDAGARRELAAKVRAVATTLWVGLRPTSATPLHRRVGPTRHFSWTAMDMRDIRVLRQAYGGSLNDVGLGLVTGAMAHIFAGRRGRAPRLRAMAPTSALTRRELQESLGNRVYAPLVDLPVGVPDPDERLRRIQATTRALAERQQGLGWDVLMEVAEFTGVNSQRFAMWVATRMRGYNVVLTLIPGPPTPLYLMGSKMLAVYPILPLLDHQTVTIGVFRYVGQLHWGIVSTPEYHQSFPSLVSALEAALAELQEHARSTRVAARQSERSVAS